MAGRPAGRRPGRVRAGRAAVAGVDPVSVSVVTGGAGFVGTNVVRRLANAGKHVVVLDDLSRPGVDQNLRWLEDTYGNRLTVEVADVCDSATLRRALADAVEVFHLA